MPRAPTERPPGEHLATLARVLRQIDASTKLGEARKSAVKRFLAAAMQELQAEMARPARVKKSMLDEILG
jgi:hypothetical protein